MDIVDNLKAKKDSFWSKITRKDLVYWLIITVTIAIGGWASDSSLVSHFGLGASLASIVLAMVAINYTLDRRGSIAEQVGVMNQVLDNVERATEKLEHRGEGIQDVADRLAATQMTEVTEPENLPLADATVVSIEDELGYIKGTSYLGMLILYWIVKANKSDKASSLNIFNEILEQPKDFMYYAWGYCTGLGDGGTKFKISTDFDTLKPVHIPEDLKTKVDGVINRFIEDPKKREENVELLKEKLKKIDAYFDK